jgi:hypothetical protein
LNRSQEELGLVDQNLPKNEENPELTTVVNLTNPHAELV